jgi:hypothetical protein
LHSRDTRRRRAHREVALDVIAVRDDDAVVAVAPRSSGQRISDAK